MSGVLIGINLGGSFGQMRWSNVSNIFKNVPSCTVTRDCSVLKSDGVEVVGSYRDYL